MVPGRIVRKGSPGPLGDPSIFVAMEPPREDLTLDGGIDFDLSDILEGFGEVLSILLEQIYIQ